jgi:hypothetical protein
MAAIDIGASSFALESRVDSPTIDRQREVVPRPDPLPGSTAEQKLRLKRAFRLLGYFSLLIAAIAVLLVMRGQNGLHLHMLIATAFGIGLTVFIGGALMLLIFYSAASGHDEAASHYDPKDDQ